MSPFFHILTLANNTLPLYDNKPDLLISIVDVLGTFFILGFMIWMVKLCFEERKAP